MPAVNRPTLGAEPDSLDEQKVAGDQVANVMNGGKRNCVGWMHCDDDIAAHNTGVRFDITEIVHDRLCKFDLVTGPELDGIGSKRLRFVHECGMSMLAVAL